MIFCHVYLWFIETHQHNTTISFTLICYFKAILSMLPKNVVENMPKRYTSFWSMVKYKLQYSNFTEIFNIQKTTRYNPPKEERRHKSCESLIGTSESIWVLFLMQNYHSSGKKSYIVVYSIISANLSLSEKLLCIAAFLSNSIIVVD